MSNPITRAVRWLVTPPSPRCGACRHAHPGVLDDGTTTLWCKRHPPVIVSVDGAVTQLPGPQVQPTDGCGDWSGL